MTTTPNSLPGLLPCPFCGGAAATENYILEAVARCATCGAKITRQHNAKEDTGLFAAREAWNTRAALGSPDTAGWISVDERIPEPEIDVLCWDGRAIFVDWFGAKRDCGRGVTHWQPLPQAPGVNMTTRTNLTALVARFVFELPFLLGGGLILILGLSAGCRYSAWWFVPVAIWFCAAAFLVWQDAVPQPPKEAI